MGIGNSRDVEKEVWDVFDSLSGDGLDVKALRLKAIELALKSRVAGVKSKADDEEEGDVNTVRRARAKQS